MRAILVTMILLATTLAAADDGELERLRRENAELRAQVAALQQQVVTLQQQKQAAVERADEAVSRAAAVETDAQANFIRRSYDADTGRTVVQTVPSELEVTHGPGRYRWFALMADFPGQQPRGVEPVQFTIRADMSKGQLRSARNLVMEVDGTLLTWPVSRHELTNRRRVGPSSELMGDEYLTVTFPAGDLAKVGAAQSVKGSLPGLRFELTFSQRRAFHAMAKELGVN